MIEEYDIIAAIGVHTLAQKVNEAIKDGWMVYGTPFVDNSTEQMYQTVVKMLMPTHTHSTKQ